MDDWYPMWEIVFSREQVIFLIANLELLIEGIYPISPYGSSYTDLPGRQHRHEGKFVKTCELGAEIESRLSRTGVDGKLLSAEIKLKFAFEDLSPESRMALNYCSGWKRRRQSYAQWTAERRYRKTIKR